MHVWKLSEKKNKYTSKIISQLKKAIAREERKKTKGEKKHNQKQGENKRIKVIKREIIESNHKERKKNGSKKRKKRVQEEN